MAEQHVIETDVLILGCGIAGGTVALQLADAGIQVTVVTSAEEARQTNTYYAQGGIIYRGQGDTADLLAEDIQRAGAGICNPEAVQILAEQGPAYVKSILLDRLKVPFDTDANGAPLVIKEAAHAMPRIIHAADATGRAIGTTLVKALHDHPKVTLLVGHTAVDLLTLVHHAKDRLRMYGPNTCVGAYILRQETGEVIRCLAKQTVLATGGLGQIYLRTTNPSGARGDGLSMAYRAGARVLNCEFVQFHPTTFHKQGAPHFLISEAVRGAGARLVNAQGEPFMEKYDAEWLDLAPRDVVARSIHREMLATGQENVYLDLRSYMSTAEIYRRFPSIAAACREHGVDIATDLVPVVPGTHYFCGGVWVDAWARTTIHQLYAVGEVSCTGVHGANRLASTSLLEGLVWGARAAEQIQHTLAQTPLLSPDEIPIWQNYSTETADPALIQQDMAAIKQIMWNYVGLVRTTARLKRALRELRHLETEIEDFYRTIKIDDRLLGLRNAVRAAILITKAAWWNRTSVGCHYRE